MAAAGFETGLEWPLPSPELCEPGFKIEPSMEAAAWIKQTFVLEGGRHYNPEHAHLAKADIVVLFVNREEEDGGMPVVGRAEIIKVAGKPWKQAERLDHLCMLHGNLPQARIWLYGPAWSAGDYWQACSTAEHELYHFAQLVKEGEPQFDDLERPKLVSRAHDLGEFVGVARRYGINRCGGRAIDFVQAALQPPTIAPATFVPTPGVCACGVRLS